MTSAPSDLDALWFRGANSAVDPRLPGGYFVRGWNVSNRGGVIKTRPGTRFCFNLPAGKVQAFTAFDPIAGPPTLVFVIAGSVYTSEYPFTRLRRLSLTMASDAPRVWVQQCTQFLTTNPDGSLQVIHPKRVLIFQDGLSAPGYYDGYNSGKLTGEDVTPQGTAMAWSGNRLWVARRDRIFASDYGNPFSFVEQYYLGGSDSLLMPETIVGMAEVPGAGNSSILLAFGRNQTVSIRSGVLNREQWPTTDNFQQTVFPDVGCVSERSIASQYGYLWWYSTRGLVSIDLAAQTNSSSAVAVADNEMAWSKAYTTPGIDSIQSIAYENLLLIAAPFGDVDNTQTWVLDSSVVQTLTDAAPPAWSGVWTGFKPAAWAKMTVMGSERLYMVDSAHDGGNSLVEMFAGNRTDSGQDIECHVELRSMTGGIPVLKAFKFADLTFSDVRGTTDFRVDWRGYSRGAWKKCLDYRAKVGIGPFRPDMPIDADETLIQNYVGQMRRMQTQDVASNKQEIEFSTCGREVDLREAWDWGFSFLVSWNGNAVLREFTPVFDTKPVERIVGKCLEDDEEESFTRWDGSAQSSITTLETMLPDVFIGYGTASGTWEGHSVEANATARSLISQRTADKCAEQAAKSQVAYTLFVEAPLVIAPDPE